MKHKQDNNNESYFDLDWTVSQALNNLESISQ